MAGATFCACKESMQSDETIKSAIIFSKSFYSLKMTMGHFTTKMPSFKLLFIK
ncbi:MAG: hypothetical protein CM15mP17_15970 [Gammaproteobacteria bacterium]|nr:MAG: hypothetical protein CM15mP17_15970 [Gammaproteobacteria bacterium]